MHIVRKIEIITAREKRRKQINKINSDFVSQKSNFIIAASWLSEDRKLPAQALHKLIETVQKQWLRLQLPQSKILSFRTMVEKRCISRPNLPRSGVCALILDTIARRICLTGGATLELNRAF